jgi:hypothetical protein
MPIGGSRPDELLWLSGGGLYVAPLLAIPALFVDYVIASRTDAVVPFLILWLLCVAPSTVLQLVRPRYPYALGLRTSIRLP